VFPALLLSAALLGIAPEEDKPYLAITVADEQTGRRAYAVDPALSLPVYQRGEKPLCLVWRRSR
jgi:hypothetical protein